MGENHLHVHVCGGGGWGRVCAQNYSNFFTYIGACFINICIGGSVVISSNFATLIWGGGGGGVVGSSIKLFIAAKLIPRGSSIPLANWILANTSSLPSGGEHIQSCKIFEK